MSCVWVWLRFVRVRVVVVIVPFRPFTAIVEGYGVAGAEGGSLMVILPELLKVVAELLVVVMWRLQPPSVPVLPGSQGTERATGDMSGTDPRRPWLCAGSRCRLVVSSHRAGEPRRPPRSS